MWGTLVLIQTAYSWQLVRKKESGDNRLSSVWWKKLNLTDRIRSSLFHTGVIAALWSNLEGELLSQDGKEEPDT